ncbi:hypothetical protein FB451DRAFT_1225594 [Mycena latifolia]|nr:hypothetical protein FB451DRAFT_1225594 [Mycena latifolia]
MLIPAASNGIVSFSAFSTWNATAATFISRCQNCSLASAAGISGAFEFVVFHPYELPNYPTPVAVANITALENTDYAWFLHAAGFT